MNEVKKEDCWVTAKELKEAIKDIADDTIIVISKDSEGNGYSPLSKDLFIGVYKPDSTWSGDIGYKVLTEELIKEGYGDGDIIEDGIDCVVLYPIN